MLANTVAVLDTAATPPSASWGSNTGGSDRCDRWFGGGAEPQRLPEPADGTGTQGRQRPNESLLPILVGLDASPASKRALDWAVVRAQAGHTALLVVHVVAWPRPLDPYGAAGIPLETFLEAGQHLLDSAAQHAKQAAPQLIVSTHLQAGSPAEILLHKGSAADLIVLGRSMPEWWHRVCRWTVNSRVTRHARGHVVIVSASNEAPM